MTSQGPEQIPDRDSEHLAAPESVPQSESINEVAEPDLEPREEPDSEPIKEPNLQQLTESAQESTDASASKSAVSEQSAQSEPSVSAPQAAGPSVLVPSVSPAPVLRQAVPNNYPGRISYNFLQVLLWAVAIAIWAIALPPTQYYRRLLDHGRSTLATVAGVQRRTVRRDVYDDVDLVIHYMGKDYKSRFSYSVPPPAPKVGSQVAVQFLPRKPENCYALLSGNVDALAFSLWSRIIFFYCVGGIVPVMALYGWLKLNIASENEKRLLQTGLTTAGCIEKVVGDMRKDGRSEVIYNFEQGPSSSMLVPNSLLKDLKEGAAVVVIYNPDNKQESTVNGLGYFKAEIS